ncbi:aldose 1-epimerase [Shouchella clausii]|nr:aldose 1-epimerase [Shouchella clausii]
MEPKINIIKNGWKQIRLQNKHGMRLDCLDYGGIVTRIDAFDRNGQLANVALGYKDMSEYTDNSPYFGALIGRVAGRIAGASFTAGGKQIHVQANEGANHLHGGASGLHQIRFETETFTSARGSGVRFHHRSPNGDGGYPGNVDIDIVYTLTDDNEWILSYTAETDKRTPLTLTNHTYFNLASETGATIHDHVLEMDASAYLELDNELIATGKIVDAKGSLFDFRQGRTFRQGLENGIEQNQCVGNGYDHYFLLDHTKNESVRVYEPKSGRVLAMETTQPGLVLYTGNSLGSEPELTDGHSRKHAGFCLEAQASPASLQYDDLPQIWLEPGTIYQHETVYRFSTQSE